jgi:5-formyltetrahydrofolate cyclo-ligase
MDTRARKASIRRVVLSRRARITADRRAEAGAAIAERLLALPEVAEAERILAFVSIGSEVSTADLLAAVLENGRTLLLPFVSEDGTMRASVVGSLAELEPGFRGIPEPRARMPVDPTFASAIVVPGVAFDPRGGRLGFGGGFYDAFLANAPGVPKVGICFEVQLVDEVPMEQHDVSVDIVVTEERVVRAPQGR